MATKRSGTDHVVLDMRTGDLLCEHCGGTYHITLPAPVNMWVAQSKEFTKMHRHCKKTWTRPPEPVVDPAMSKEARINWWIHQGERGISSNTMLEVITGRVCTDRGHFGRCHAHDPDDFKRCWKLLQAVPELREGFPQLAKESPVWAALVQHWDELAAMMPTVLEEWKLPRGSEIPTATKMYELMKALGC